MAELAGRLIAFGSSQSFVHFWRKHKCICILTHYHDCWEVFYHSVSLRKQTHSVYVISQMQQKVLD